METSALALRLLAVNPDDPEQRSIYENSHQHIAGLAKTTKKSEQVTIELTRAKISLNTLCHANPKQFNSIRREKAN